MAPDTLPAIFMEMKTVKIGTRGSPLALRQSSWVKEALSGHYPHLEIEMVIIRTTGDKILDVPLGGYRG